MNSYDLLFVGHITIDEIEAKEGSARGVPGGAPLFGALPRLQAARVLRWLREWPKKMKVILPH